MYVSSRGCDIESVEINNWPALIFPYDLNVITNCDLDLEAFAVY